MTESRGRVYSSGEAESQKSFYHFGFSGRGLVGSSAIYFDSDTAMEADIKIKRKKKMVEETQPTGWHPGELEDTS